MNPCPRRYLLALALVGWASSQCPAKESSLSLPQKPGAHYGPTEALAELAGWGVPVSASEPQRVLMNCLFHQSFGGATSDVSWMDHPRICQALWLALATHGVATRSASAEDFRFGLEHFAKQKALDGTITAFFTTLWNAPAEEAMQESAAEFLFDWLASFDLPAMSTSEQKAVNQAVKAGVLSLRWGKAADPVEK